MTREDFLLLSVTSGSPRLADQLPVLASVFSVHGQQDRRVYVAEFAAPLRIPLPADVDPQRCAPEYLDADGDGLFIWAYFAAVRPNPDSARTVAPRRAEMAAEFGIIADQAAFVDSGVDSALDLANVIWAAGVTIGLVEPEHAISLEFDGGIDAPPVGPLTVAESPVSVTGSVDGQPMWAPVAATRPLDWRRIALIVGMVVVVVLIGLAAGFVLHREREQSPVPSIETSTPTTTSVARTTTSEAPPPPPLPAPSTSETPTTTYVPSTTPSQSRPNITTPQTRPPDISVRPTHRPAFPNQPG